MRSNQPRIAYGIDIGGYWLGKKRGILKKTRMHWARIESDTQLQFDPIPERFSVTSRGVSDKDLKKLIASVIADIKARRQIAIGIEAPMWQPGPFNLPDNSFSLYHERFRQERPNFLWYQQSGASATVRSLSVGRLLFDGLKESGLSPSCSTTDRDAQVFLFEGFVAGKNHKILEGGDSHANDAITTAVGFHYACDERRTKLALLHAPESFSNPVWSHWAAIVADAGMQCEKCRGDCMVVGFDKFSQSLREACDSPLGT